MADELKVSFPQGKVYVGTDQKAYIEYNQNFVNKFNNNLNKGQMFLDKTVSEALQPYVSFKTGTQEKSIKVATVLGSGKIVIGVPYAEYQAYSKNIKKIVGKRGTQPFERMVKDKKQVILKQMSDYLRRLNDG